MLVPAGNVATIAQTEDDGSITRANATGIAAGAAGLVQANGTIGDGPYGRTSGDYDAYALGVAAGSVLTVAVDAAMLNTGLDAVIEVYNSAGTLVASNDTSNTGNSSENKDPFLQYTAAATDTYTVVVHGAGRAALSDPFNAASGAGVGSTGDYRIFINSAFAADDPHIYHGTPNADTLVGGNGGNVFYGLSGADRLTGGTGNDLFVRFAEAVNGPPYARDTVNGGAGYDVQQVSEFVGLPERIFLDANGVGKAFYQTHIALDTRGFVDMTSIERFDLYGFGNNQQFDVSNLAGSGLTDVRYFGGSGANILNTTAATNYFQFHGGPGNDTVLLGYNVADNGIFDGELGNGDTFSFAGYTAAAIVDLRSSQIQNTHSSSGGPLASLSSIRNFEIAVGSNFADELIGSPGTETLNGGAGDDRLTGAGSYRWGANGAVPLIADVSGDGRADIVQVETNGEIDVWTSSGAMLNNAEFWGRSASANIHSGDVNGDGRADLIDLNVDGNAYIFSSAGSSFALRTIGATGVTPNDRIADVNGDGRADIVQVYQGTAYAWLSNGTSFNNYSVWGTGFRATDQFADFNGDGRTDAIQLHENGNAYVWLSNGSSFDAYSVWGSDFTPNDHIADVDGDGRSDVIQFYNQTAYVWLSNGSSFGTYSAWGSGFRSTDQFADFNGDGRADVIQLHENGNAYVWLSNGSSFASASVWGTGVTPNDRVADFNGDGRADIVQLGGNTNAYVWLSNGTAFDAYQVWGRSGTGSDTFYFTGSIGHDIVTDFHAGPGGDVVQFDHFQFASFDAVMARTADDAQGNAVIHYDAAGNDTITLMHVSRSMLVADNFLL